MIVQCLKVKQASGLAGETCNWKNKIQWEVYPQIWIPVSGPRWKVSGEASREFDWGYPIVSKFFKLKDESR